MTVNTAAAPAAGEEGGFAALLADLETMAKALPAAKGAADNSDDEDETVEAAAADGAAEGGDNPDDDAGEGNNDEGDDKTFGKSFPVTLADGSVVDALDGTAMMKSLHDENTVLRARTEELGSVVVGVGSLLKSMHAAQAEDRKLIKSLKADIAKLGTSGSGRRAVLNINEKAPAGRVAETPAAPPSTETIMAKAMSLQTEGKMSGSDVNRIFAHTSRGYGVPPELAHHFTA